MDIREEKTDRSLTQEEIHGTRLLALHLRPKRFGFAVFKGPRQLLDWGGSAYMPRNGVEPVLVGKRISSLLTIYAPSVIVIRRLGKKERQRYRDIQPIVGMVRTLAKKHSSELVLIGREEVRHAFRRFGKTTKYNIARRVAIIFSELMWKLPPPRKSWQTEHYNMAIFDAVSLGIAYFGRFGEFELDHQKATEDSEPE